MKNKDHGRIRLKASSPVQFVIWSLDGQVFNNITKDFKCNLILDIEQPLLILGENVR
jgi:hypothetical protein